MRSGAPEPLGLTLPFPHPIPRPHRTIDPHALKIPAAKRRNTRYPKTATLHFRLNQDKNAMTFLGVRSDFGKPSCIFLSISGEQGSHLIQSPLVTQPRTASSSVILAS